MTQKIIIPDKVPYEAPFSAVLDAQGLQLICTSELEGAVLTDPFIIDEPFNFDLL